MVDTAEQIPFRPRARLLQLLGDQLIGTPRLAVFELVKNAYDADAENVVVTLKNITSDSPNIIVEDDGDGMTISTVRDIWLVPADDHREKQRLARRRTARNRLPLGEKGLGRFAVHKLGDRIELITRAAQSSEVVVAIDWRQLIDERFLADAMVEVRTRDPEHFKDGATGTRIVIRSLREREWNRGEVRRLQRQITSISSPFTKRSDKFVATLRVSDHPDWVAGVPDVKALLRRAPWKYTFTFKNGTLDFVYQFRGVSGMKVEKRAVKLDDQRLQLADLPGKSKDDTPAGYRKKRKKVVADENTTDGIGPVKGTLWIFDRDSDVLSQLGEKQLLQTYLDENGGIRVYRDGIRVYDYGEREDDWLGLDLRRVNRPTRNISRNIVVGAIDLKLEHSEELIEKTNREGFVENDAYDRLRQIVLGALGVLETERKKDKDRIRALTRAPRDLEADRLAKPLEELRRIATRHKVIDEFEPVISRVENDYDELRRTLLRANVSGLGLAVVFHEIEQGVRLLYNAIGTKADPQALKEQAHELVRVLDGFSELLRQGDKQDYSLRFLVKRVRDLNRARFRSHNVRLVAPILEDGHADFEAHFAFGLVLGALNNILDNAFHWLKVRWPDEEQIPSPRAIYINVRDDIGDGPTVVVADTGPGLSDEPAQLVVPFFSRREGGMGIGLYYSNLAMELNGGTLSFPDRDDLDLPDEFEGATVGLTFSASTED